MLPGSSTNSFVAGEMTTTCPLLTPSPPTNDSINPLSEPEQPTFTIEKELAIKVQHVTDGKKERVYSASTTSACTQLLNHKHTAYHHITKDDNNTSQEANGKVQSLQLTFRKPPEDYFFINWNGPSTRKVFLWIVLFGLITMVAPVTSTLSKTCDPPTQWYQGGVLYEIFPASFSDSNNDGIGDLAGISLRADYFLSLGIRGVRLNSIFRAEHYPERYQNVSSLIEIASELGTINDFKMLVNSLHLRNISVLLDLPIWPIVETLQPNVAEVHQYNKVEYKSSSVEFLKSASLTESSSYDEITEAILFWLQHGVEGFYLKGLENHLDDTNFVASIARWKKVLGPDRPIIGHYSLIQKASKSVLNVILNNIDLVDIQLNIEEGTEKFAQQMDSVLNGTLYSTSSMPWVHWNLGSVDSTRLANRLIHSNVTLGVMLLQLMLPGTTSVFYGDEIGLKQILDSHGDRSGISHLRNLAPMVWNRPKIQFTRKEILPWMPGQTTHSSFDQLDLISKMVGLRKKSPSIYLSSVTKDGATKANAEAKKSSENDLLVIQRWYPGRNNFTVVSNLGATHKISDLSKSLHSGNIVIGPRANSIPERVNFKSMSLWPGESVVIILD